MRQRRMYVARPRKEGEGKGEAEEDPAPTAWPRDTCIRGGGASDQYSAEVDSRNGLDQTAFTGRARRCERMDRSCKVMNEVGEYMGET